MTSPASQRDRPRDRLQEKKSRWQMSSGWKKVTGIIYTQFKRALVPYLMRSCQHVELIRCT